MNTTPPNQNFSPSRSIPVQYSHFSESHHPQYSHLPTQTQNTHPIPINNESNSFEYADTDVFVYWDYENVSIPSVIGSDVEKCEFFLNNLTNLFRSKGLVRSRTVYTNFESISNVQSKNFKRLRNPKVMFSRFSFSNISVADPKPEAVDKRIIADMLFDLYLNSMDNKTTNRRFCPILISADHDFSYILHRLQDYGVSPILIVNSNNPLSPSLLGSASQVYDISDFFPKDPENGSLTSRSSQSFTESASRETGKRLFWSGIHDTSEFERTLRKKYPTVDPGNGMNTYEGLFIPRAPIPQINMKLPGRNVSVNLNQNNQNQNLGLIPRVPHTVPDTVPYISNTTLKPVSNSHPNGYIVDSTDISSNINELDEKNTKQHYPNMSPFEPEISQYSWSSTEKIPKHLAKNASSSDSFHVYDDTTICVDPPLDLPSRDLDRIPQLKRYFGQDLFFPTKTSLCSTWIDLLYNIHSSGSKTPYKAQNFFKKHRNDYQELREWNDKYGPEITKIIFPSSDTPKPTDSFLEWSLVQTPMKINP